ncbi:hypothetical protein M3P05_16585 [Sansalvadorimonas sp. 2012CJ34-2]|uniref:Uncharacterized protein n=1 Tax=Parendozoicomonas callyspongiae TaxID=2942213 RepID=A0ABT0PJG5_9GAMM|nr:hypothetical protein [Sansalvadorimonas sp. 2012CJ34-2]MCL6271534.1 hypothetical protein [Sansalvadorimonas sp. 2012CJ34-2]
MAMGNISRNVTLGAGIGGLGGLIMAGPPGLALGGVVGGAIGSVWAVAIPSSHMPDIPSTHIDRRDTWHCLEADDEMVVSPAVPTNLLIDIVLEDLVELRVLLEQKESSQSTRQLLIDLYELQHFFKQVKSYPGCPADSIARQKALSLWGKKIAIQLAPMADQNEQIKILRDELRTTMDQYKEAS